jgi:hypothetical protein
MRNFWGGVAAGLLGLMVLGCSDEPTLENSLTAPVPFAAYVFRDTTIPSIGDTIGRYGVPMNGAYNLVGRDGSYAAHLLMGFYGNLFPLRDTILVVSAAVRLRGATFSGDSSGTYGFTVHRIERGWSANTFTADSLTAGFYDPGIVRGRFNGIVGPDTQQISVDLDTAMVREWFSSSSTSNKYGFILVPTQDSRLIRGFVSFDADSSKNLPTLEVIATNTAGTTRDTTRFSLGVDTFVGALDPFTPQPGILYLQSGVLIRGALRFDVSFIPRGSTIHKAELRLQYEPATSRLNRFSGDTALAAHVLLSESDLLQFASGSVQVRRVSDTPTGYLADIRSAVQAWVKGPNYGILLRMGSGLEYSSLDLVTIRTRAAADPAQRPTLRIIYSQTFQ